MVEIETLEEGASATTLTSEEIEVEGAPLSEDASPVLTASAERLLDAEAIEMAAASIDRPTARAHLEALSKKLRRDASALLKVEESRSKADMEEKGNGKRVLRRIPLQPPPHRPRRSALPRPSALPRLRSYPPPESLRPSTDSLSMPGVTIRSASHCTCPFPVSAASPASASPPSSPPRVLT